MMGLGRRPGLAGTATLLARLPFKGRMHRGSGGGQLEPEVSWLYSRILAETYWGPFWIAETLEHCPQPLSLPRLSPRTEKKARGTVAAQLFRLQNSTWGLSCYLWGAQGLGVAQRWPQVVVTATWAHPPNQVSRSALLVGQPCQTPHMSS